jgi:hypothetical protein
MERSMALAVLTGLLVYPNAGYAQEAFTIKLKERAVGDSVFIKRNSAMTGKVTVASAGEVIADKSENMGEDMAYRVHLVENDIEKGSFKAERTYSKAVTIKDGQKTDLELAGKTVVIAKTGDDFEFTFKDGGMVEGGAAAALREEFSHRKKSLNADIEKPLMPTGPVKVGDSWTIDMGKIVAELADSAEMEIDGAKAKGQGTLIKAYKKDGRQFGEMKFKMEMPVVSAGNGQLEFADGAKIFLDVSYDGCIDGTSEGGTMKISVKLDCIGAGPDGITATINLDAGFEETRRDSKK